MNSTTTKQTSAPRWLWPVAIAYSLVVLAAGVWVSLASGEWLALLMATGLVILPLGGFTYGIHRAR